MQVLRHEDTKITLHNEPKRRLEGDAWLTINCKEEFFYSATVRGDVVWFDDWSAEDVREDCPEAVEALEVNGFTVGL